MKKIKMSYVSSDQKQKRSLSISLKNFFLSIFHSVTPLFIFCITSSIQITRPFFGIEDVCPFTVGCTEYVIIQFKQESFLNACYNSAQRLLMCNPISQVAKKIATRYKTSSYNVLPD